MRVDMMIARAKEKRSSRGSSTLILIYLVLSLSESSFREASPTTKGTGSAAVFANIMGLAVRLRDMTSDPNRKSVIACI